MTSPFDLTGRYFWVIGGAGHLGQDCTRLLASLGARVLCADLPGKAEALARETGAIAADLDANLTEELPGWVAAQAEAHGEPDGLVLLTYASTNKRLDDLTAQDFDAANHGNLTSSFVIAREAGRRMCAQGRGSVVLFSSMYGSVAPDPSIYEAGQNPNPIEYGVSKAGIQQMARYLAVHWGRSGVRCNSISPGPFPNPTVRSQNEGFTERLATKVPLGRVGEAPEIAGAVAFLLSDAASFITGIDMPVDGGWTAW